MSKLIPEIQITSADKVETRNSKRWQLDQKSSEEEASDGEVWAILSNLASPGRIRTAVYSLSGGSDTLSDPLSLSDDDQLVNRLSFCLPSATNENTDIKECFLTKKLYSPSKSLQTMNAENPSSFFNLHTIETHTDNEVFYSDTEMRGTRREKGIILDGFVSDLDDSDSSLSDNHISNSRKNSLNTGKQKRHSYNERKKSEPILPSLHPSYDLNLHFSRIMQMNKDRNSTGQKKKTNSALSKLANVKTSICGRKGSSEITKNRILDDQGSYTDIEEVDYEEMDYNTDKPVVSFIPESRREIVIANENMKGDVSLILPINKSSNMKLPLKMEGFDCGFSDVEELPDYIEEEIQNCPTPEPPITEASFVKSTETITEKSKLQVLVERREPLTDTEEINVKNEEKHRKIKIKDFGLLKAEKSSTDPLTDTEEILIYSNNESETGKSKYYNLRIDRRITEPLTDSEEIMVEENYESNKKPKHCFQLERDHSNENLVSSKDQLDIPQAEISFHGIHQNLTDIEEFSDDEFSNERTEDKFYKEFQVISACNFTNLRESHKPFSEKAKADLRSCKSSILMQPELTSPSGLTEQEDLSGEEEHIISPLDLPLEPHISTVYIQNSRSFQPDTSELKVNIPPDPLTDTEDIDINLDKKN